MKLISTWGKKLYNGIKVSILTVNPCPELVACLGSQAGCVCFLSCSALQSTIFRKSTAGGNSSNNHNSDARRQAEGGGGGMASFDKWLYLHTLSKPVISTKPLQAYPWLFGGLLLGDNAAFSKPSVLVV